MAGLGEGYHSLNSPCIQKEQTLLCQMTKCFRGNLMIWGHNIPRTHTILQMWKLRLKMEEFLSAIRSLVKLENQFPATGLHPHKAGILIVGLQL